MKSVGIALGLVTALCLLGCEEEPQSAAKPPAAAPAPVKPVAAPVATVAPVALESIPTEEDFEQEAAKEITVANLGQQLDSLEKEVASE